MINVCPGTWQNTAQGAACPQLAEAAGRATKRRSWFDPQPALACQFGCGAHRPLDVVVYARRPVGGRGDTVSLIIRRLGNRLRREHLLRYCDQLPIFLEEALPRR